MTFTSLIRPSRDLSRIKDPVEIFVVIFASLLIESFRMVQESETPGKDLFAFIFARSIITFSEDEDCTAGPVVGISVERELVSHALALQRGPRALGVGRRILAVLPAVCVPSESGGTSKSQEWCRLVRPIKEWFVYLQIQSIRDVKKQHTNGGNIKFEF